MRFFNYGRKSIYSDSSDSIDNQFRMCREHCELRYSGQVDSWERFSDEDFTGANTDRPGLQQMLDEIRAGCCDVLVVYQLDRLSRDVRDFANIYSLLQDCHVEFVSLKENIDTTTPIGRAMMYVTVVFAQMERETIAQRVNDNMIGLAKKGYWTGGNPPYGYIRQRIEIAGRKHVTLIPDPEGVKYTLKIFDDFLENNYSLQSMETAYRRAGVKTARGAFFSTTQLHKILTTPLYAENTQEIYDFLEGRGYKMDPDSPREKWDGRHGIIVYGRTTQKNKKHQIAPVGDRLVCIGYHEPFVPADKWLAAQARLHRNVFQKTNKYDIPLLKGVLRCKKCGVLMQVARKKLVNSVSSHYYCLTRMRRGIEVCDGRMLKCEVLDERALAVFQEIEANPTAIKNYVAETERPREVPGVSEIKRKIGLQESRIGRLTASLAEAGESSAMKYILAEIERQDLSLQALKRQLDMARASDREEKRRERSAEQRAAVIARLIRGFAEFTASEKNEIVRAVVRECTWDGETLFLRL